MIGCVLRCSARGSAQRSGGRSPCKRRWFTRRLPGPISLISATLPLLQGELDFFGYPSPLEELNFHVAYLAEKGLVAVEGVRGPHTHRNISLVKITAKGIDYRDGRLPTDEGIYLEPGR